MIDCFGYKCEPLDEITPLIRISNAWPELPPEDSTGDRDIDWEELFPQIRDLYNKKVSLDDIAEHLCIASTYSIRYRVRAWAKAGLLKQRPHPRQPGKWRSEFDAIVKSSLLAGETSKVIGARIGISHDVVLRHAHAMGMVCVNPGAPDQYWALDTTGRECA